MVENWGHKYSTECNVNCYFMIKRRQVHNYLANDLELLTKDQEATMIGPESVNCVPANVALPVQVRH